MLTGCASSTMTVTASGSGATYESSLNNALLNASKSVGVEVTNVRTTTNGDLSEQLATSSNGLIKSYKVIESSDNKVTIVAEVEDRKILSTGQTNINDLQVNVDKFIQLDKINNEKSKSLASLIELMPTKGHTFKSNISARYNKTMYIDYDIRVKPDKDYWSRVKKFATKTHAYFDPTEVYGAPWSTMPLIHGKDTNMMHTSIEFTDNGMVVLKYERCQRAGYIYQSDIWDNKQFADDYAFFGTTGTIAVEMTREVMDAMKKVTNTETKMRLQKTDDCGKLSYQFSQTYPRKEQ